MSEVKIDKKTTFEEAVAELEELIADMEEGRKPLEKLIGSFERGVALSKYCRAKLAEMEKRVELLTRDDGESGEWREAELNLGASDSPR